MHARREGGKGGRGGEKREKERKRTRPWANTAIGNRVITTTKIIITIHIIMQMFGATRANTQRHPLSLSNIFFYLLFLFLLFTLSIRNLKLDWRESERERVEERWKWILSVYWLTYLICLCKLLQGKLYGGQGQKIKQQLKKTGRFKFCPYLWAFGSRKKRPGQIARQLIQK